MANDTMIKFGYPDSLVREFDHWVVLLRPGQVTLGSLVLAAKGSSTAFGDLPEGAHAELATITAQIEATLRAEVQYERINYLMLMMVDPHVHFHVFPRYEGSRKFEELLIVDNGWPGPPDLKSAPELPAETLHRVRDRLMRKWLIIY